MEMSYTKHHKEYRIKFVSNRSCLDRSAIIWSFWKFNLSLRFYFLANPVLGEREREKKKEVQLIKKYGNVLYNTFSIWKCVK